MSQRGRIRRNRRRRVHAAELRRHEMEADGILAPRTSRPPRSASPELVDDRVADQVVDRDVEERRWRATWGIDR